VNLLNLRNLDVVSSLQPSHDVRTVRPESERRGCPHLNPWRPLRGGGGHYDQREQLAPAVPLEPLSAWAS
jgi:hypothetical protein